MKRKTGLLVCLLALLLSLGGGAEDAPRIIVASDLHFVSPTLTDHGAYFTRLVEQGDGKMVHLIDEITDAFCQEVIARSPECLVISGDLTFNGAEKSHEDMAAKLRRIEASGVKVYVLPGNHDLDCYAAASFSGEGYTPVDSVSSERFAEIYHDLGFDEALSRDPYSLSYAVQPFPGVRLLLLDVNTRLQEGAVTNNTFFWLESMLLAAKKAGEKVIAVSHQNLYTHAELFDEGFVISNADRLTALYEAYDVLLNLSGHMHIQHTMTPAGRTPEIAVSSLAVSPCQYGIITFADDHLYYATRPVDVTAWAADTGNTKQELVQFRQYAADFFDRASAHQTGDDADARAMAAWLEELNAAYFSGRMDTIDARSEYALRWAADDTFFGRYVRGILGEELRDHTQMVIPYERGSAK